MKSLVLLLLLFLGHIFWLSDTNGQGLPEILEQVLSTDTTYESISCTIDITLDVPGISMPEKEIELRLEKGKAPKIKSEGITILPKHGIIGQYREFLEAEGQVISLYEHGDTVAYKIVSLDRKTDWVTVDLTLTQSDAHVHRMIISTRKHGEYLVRHFYSDTTELFPEQTEVSFESIPFNLPLKFMGKQEGLEIMTHEKGPVTGKILLRYSEVSWVK